jgi:glycosyltransferase involved in cell wall biosynthesis
VLQVFETEKSILNLIELEKLINTNYQMVLVGLNKKQLKELPNFIIGIARAESLQELAALYSAADVFINPTYVDNFTFTNIEYLACGTPEAVDHTTGVVCEKGGIDGLWNAINKLCLYY